jgi:hypothetical protein
MKRIACLLALAVAIPVAAQNGDPSGDPATVAALESALLIERALTSEDRERFGEWANKRRAVEERLDQLQLALEEAVADEAGPASQLEPLIGQLERAEAERSEILSAERVLLDRLRDRLRRIALTEEQLLAATGSEPSPAGALSGRWDLTLMPGEQEGTCTLTQSGTLVSGTYRLSGGFDGSFQGTLIQRKVYLVRIDSRLGRSMELEGFLSSDGKMIRGTWESYELASGGAEGFWSAKRRTDEP